MLERFIDALLHTLLDLGYPGIVVLMAMESSILPVPSELVMPPAGYWAAKGQMSFPVALICGVVGSVIGGWDGWRGNIYRLAVAPDARRHGLARRLVQEAERMLVSKGARRISALVERHEAHAVGFWDALSDRGWRRDERMLRYIKMTE